MPKLSLQKVRHLALNFLVVALIFAVGYFIGNKGLGLDFSNFPKVSISRELPINRQNVDFSLFWRVWDTLETSYFDKSKINEGDMVYGSIKGMVEALGDPYTAFLTPSENKITQEDLNGSFEGVGIQIGFKGKQLAIIAPLPDSPAEEAGVKAGDFIIGIKDEVKKIDRGTVGISLPEAVEIIRGRAGSKVTLLLLRDGQAEPIAVEITRKKLNVPTLVLSYVGEGGSLVHIRLLKFGAETESEWNKAVREILAKKEVKGIILDLRNNPGGYLQSAVDVASDFVKTGAVVVVEERGDGGKIEFKSERIGLLTKLPLVILVNEGSASASEILAGALRDLNKVKIVGEKSFGKGTIQEPLQLEGGTGLHITVARWLTPSGTWVNGTGLEPDVKIEDDEKTTEDEQLQEAIKLLNE